MIANGRFSGNCLAALRTSRFMSTEPAYKEPPIFAEDVPVFRKSNLTGESYQFLPKSKIPTYHFQKSLRRLPIPKVDKTCERLLAAARPLLTDDKFNDLQSVVSSFQRNEAPGLQKELLKYDRKHKDTSYVSEAWFDMYLRSRDPCPVNFNPFMTFAPDPEVAYNDQLTRATNFAISFGRMKRSLDANWLEPEVFHLNPKKSDTPFFRKVCSSLPSNMSWYGAVLFKAFPLDMSQYSSLFGGARIPCQGKDLLHHCPDAKHFIVIYKGSFFAVDLFDKNGILAPPEQVHACLAKILATTTSARPSECVGSLTSLERNRWAKVRLELSSLGNNQASLAAIDNALFAICLDSSNTDDPQHLIRSLLIGDDASNRWFDKCFQLIVDARGLSTINFEHSWGDGVAVLRLMEESFRDVNRNPFVQPYQPLDQTIDVNRHLRPVEFTLSNGLKGQIEEAQKMHLSIAPRMQFSTAVYEGLNKELIKRSKLSPDSLMQLAIQFAFYKLYKEFVPTYESCSTAAFLKGRTECMRSATDATKDTVLALRGSSEGIYEKLVACSKRHSQLVKEAALGQGFDRHLFGLRITAERLNQKVPALFEDASFKYMNEFILSTSTLSTDTVIFGGFGPVARNGFGIAYNVGANRMGAVISCYKDKRNADQFSLALLEGLDMLGSILRRDLK